MGVLSHLFAATPEEARRYADPRTHDALGEQLSPADYNSLTPLELGEFWALLEGSQWDPEAHGFLDESDQDEDSWLYRFPDPYVQLLAAADSSRLASARAAWAATEAFKCAPEDLAPLTSDLQQIANRAQASGRCMYLWGCT